jgi:hypothetical protein
MAGFQVKLNGARMPDGLRVRPTLSCRRDLLAWVGRALRRAGISVTLVFAVSSTLAQSDTQVDIKANDLSFSTLDALSKRLIDSDRYLGRTRIAVKSGNFLSIDIAPDRAAVLAPEDENLQALDVLIRSKVLDRDLSAIFPGETFWVKPLSQINDAVFRILNLNGRSEMDRRSLEAAMRQIEDRFSLIQSDALVMAQKKKLDVDSSREPATGYQVEIHIDPPKARVRYMPLLSYLLYRKTAHALDDRWIELQEGPQHLIGRYRYIAEWPPDLSGTVEGTFEVREDSKIVFRPKSK